jgi:hypothetical protein
MKTFPIGLIGALLLGFVGCATISLSAPVGFADCVI